MSLERLAFVDVETTGLSPVRDKIIEIAIVRVEKGKVKTTFSSLVNPGYYIDPQITLLTGITSEQLEKAPTFYDLKNNIRDLLSETVFVAHNVRFDYSFLKNEFSRHYDSFSAKTLCTAKLSRRLFPRFRRHSLDSIIERFNLSCEARHRAMPDALVLWDIYRIFQKQFSKKIFVSAISDISKTPSLPSYIHKKTIEKLPESPGVYIFYDRKGSPLYIGKSINVRDRVISHFYEYSRSNKEMHIYQEVRSVEAIRTSGELGALLLESNLIKENQPLLNRQLRRVNRMITLVQSENPDHYLTVKRMEVNNLKPNDFSKILAVFRTEKQLRDRLNDIADEFKLCKKLLGLTKDKKACFGSQIEQCYGACTGKELPARYNLRFVEAFAKTRVRQWPFDGPIAIKEGREAHIVYLWCYLGKTNELNGNLKTDKLYFDYDNYKILSSYLLKPNVQRKIHQLRGSSLF